MANAVTLFGPLHLSLLLAIVAIAVLLVVLCRRRVLSSRAVCLAVGCALGTDEIAWWIWRYSREGIHAGNLPLQLCDVAVWLAVAACLTRSVPLAELTWFFGIAGAGMALLTPDLWAPWPQWPAIYFFLAHGGVVIAASLLAFSGVVNFRPRSIWRSYAVLLVWAAVVGRIDAILGANYMYLRQKPGNASILDLMPPWPWYIAGGASLALALFWLLWIPFRVLPTEASRRAAAPADH
ncbi:MAG TPA: TIGR02206 family membrane protein [Bryobacteraceae bacterium]|nr:TIGR02206 family membrane protein [Bryobacteraceae bacterium]